MNKIIIPVAALAMGVALVGSVSSTLAWYQYSTKAQAAFIGTSIGESENLEIKIIDRQDSEKFQWVASANSNDINALAGVTNETELVPVSPKVADESGSLAATGALAASDIFHGGIETGVAGYGEQVASANNYIQFTLNIRYKKVQSNASYVAKRLKLINLTIADSTANNQQNQGDLFKAIRVHFSAGENNNLLFANDTADGAGNTIVTNTYGTLDTDNDGVLDNEMAYEWDASGNPVVYGIANSTQTAYNSSKVTSEASQVIGDLPANENGLAVKVTIWIEGWQKLTGLPTGNYDRRGQQPYQSAMWDPEVYHNKKFNVGMRFQADDIPAQNP